MSSLVDLPNGQQGLQLDYHFSETATRFILDPTFITGYFGVLGSSKTASLCWKGWLYAQAFPGSRVGLLRNTWPNLRHTAMAEFFKWWPPGLAGRYHKTDKIFDLFLPSGEISQIYFRHMDSEQDISNTLSLNLDALGFDEPQGGLNSTGGLDPGISVNLYRSLVARVGRDLLRPPGMVWLVGNPPPPDHWIAQEFGYDGHGAPQNPYPDRRLYLGTREDNQRNLKADYYERLQRVWGVNTPMARRYLDGAWTSFGVEKPFQNAWIQRWGPGTDVPALPPSYTDDRGGHPGLVCEIGFDPAISEKDTAARSALVVAAQVRHPSMRGRLLILEAIAGHWSVWQQVRQLLNAVTRWKARTVRIEKVAYQAALKDILDREAKTRGIHVHVELVPPDGDKLRRASAWSPLVEDGTVVFPTTGAEDLIASMLAVPGDPSRWDLVDAAGICIRGFPALEAARTRLPGPTVSTPERAQSYALRGGGMPLRAVVTWEQFGARTPDLRRRAQGYTGRRPG